MLEWGWSGWSQGHFLSPWGPICPVLPQLQEELEQRAPALCPYQASRFRLLLMLVVMKMTLLLLLFGGAWAKDLNMTTWPASNSSESPYPNLMTSIHAVTRVSEKSNHTGDHIATSRYAASEVSSPENITPANSGSPVSEPTNPQEVSTNALPMVKEISLETNNSTVPGLYNPKFLHMTNGTTVADSLDTLNGTSRPTVTMTSGSLETSNGTSESAVTMTSRSLVVSSWIDGTTGPSIIMTSSSLETSDGTSGPTTTMATTTVLITKGTSGPPVIMATSSPKTPKGTSGSLISRVKISTIPTPEPSTNTGNRSSPSSDQGTNNILLVAVFMAMLVVIVLLALLLLWRQRQKRRTGALTLSGGGKRNGVVDAWAGPAQVSDEEAVITTAGVSTGGKGSGVPDGEGSSRRPTLTTFFGRQKSRQGSLALEELKTGSGPSINGEEEPLVGSEDGALKTPSPDGPEARNMEVL